MAPDRTDGERTADFRARLVSGIRAVERTEIGPATGVLVFLAIVHLRNLIEGALERPRLIGFVRDAPVSALMVLDHFVLFYAALFVVLALSVSAATRFPIRSVLRVLLAGWVLVLAPPLLDAAFSGGAGFRITYIPDLARGAAFFDPTRALPEVSPGQRLEIAAGLLLVIGYAWAGGAGPLRAAVAGAAFYTVVLLFGALPVLFARIPFLRGAHLEGLDPVTAVFRSGGIVQHESQKHALLFLFVLLAALGVLLAKLYPPKAAAVARHLRPLRTMHYAGLALFGALLGAAMVGPHLGAPAVASPIDVLAVAAIVLSVALAFQCAAEWNDIADLRSDRVNAPDRPLVTRALLPGDASRLALLYAAGALLLALNTAHVPFLLVLGTLALSALYSFPPLRLKRIPFVATALLGAVSVVAFLAGFALFTGGRAFHLAPPRLLLALFLAVAAAFTAKDLKDVAGDRLDRVCTLPVLLGERAGRRVTALLVFLGFLLPALLLPIRWLLLPAVLFAAAGALLALRAAKPDRPLLLLYMPYAVVLFGAVLADSDSLTAPRDLEGEAAAFEGRRALLAGDDERAVDFFGRARSLAGDALSDFALEEGMARARAGRAAEAIPLLRAGVDSRPFDSRGRLYLADALRAAGEWPEAERLLARMRTLRMDPGEASSRLAAVALEKGDLRRAEREIRAERMLGARDEEVAVHEGDHALLSGDPKRGANRYREALRFEEGNAEAWAGLGRAEHALGRPSESRLAFERAIELDPPNAVYRNNAGIALRDLGMREEALASFEEARLLDPQLLHAYMNRGALLESLGDAAGAADEYRLALRALPGAIPALEALSRLAGEGPPAADRRAAPQLTN